MLATTEEAAVAYNGVRTRLTDLLSRHLDEGGTIVPACPEWTVKDVVAHLCGACEDILAGRLEGVATEPWTSAQVERFDNDDLEQVLAVWSEVGPQVEAIVPVFPPLAACQFVFDAAAHEQDVRTGLGTPGARDNDALVVGLSFAVESMRRRISSLDLPSLEVIAGERTYRFGEPPFAARLDTTVFELFRMIGGRRTADEFLAASWEGDATPFLRVFDDGGPVRPPPSPVGE